MHFVVNHNKVIENPNLKNNDKRTIRVEVLNIDSNLNSSPTSQKIAKNKSISIKKSEELFEAFRNAIRCGF